MVQIDLVVDFLTLSVIVRGIGFLGSVSHTPIYIGGPGRPQARVVGESGAGFGICRAGSGKGDGRVSLPVSFEVGSIRCVKKMKFEAT